MERESETIDMQTDIYITNVFANRFADGTSIGLQTMNGETEYIIGIWHIKTKPIYFPKKCQQSTPSRVL